MVIFQMLPKFEPIKVSYVLGSRRIECGNKVLSHAGLEVANTLLARTIPLTLRRVRTPQSGLARSSTLTTRAYHIRPDSGLRAMFSLKHRIILTSTWERLADRRRGWKYSRARRQPVRSLPSPPSHVLQSCALVICVTSRAQEALV